MDYFLARYYGSALGRFTSPDKPLVDQAEHAPQSWNLYSYVRNNPLIFTDPTGNDCVYLNGAGDSIDSINDQNTSKDCGKTGGYWVDGTVTNARFAHGSLILSGTTNGTDRTSASYGIGPGDGILALQRGTQLAEPGVNFALAATATVMGGNFAAMAYGAVVSGEAVGTLGLDLLPSQARNIRAIETAISKHVTYRDLTGAVSEGLGYAARKGNTVWNHRMELTQTASRLKTLVGRLKGSLQDPRHGATTRQVVQQAIQRGETALRQIEAALR